MLSDAAAGVHLARLRDQGTVPSDFQRHARLLGCLLALEAIRDIPMVDTEVVTPLAATTARVPARPIVAVPVLRAGLGLLPGLQELLPTATVGMVGLERDDKTLEPSEYYRKLPPVEGAWVLLLEPMLATGGSAATAVAGIADAGADRIVILSVVATQTAVDRIAKVAPDAVVVAAALDPILDDNGYIVPGLGDFGDRLFGTVH